MVEEEVVEDLGVVVLAQVDVDGVVALKGVDGVEAKEGGRVILCDDALLRARDDEEAGGLVLVEAHAVHEGLVPQELERVNVQRPDDEDQVILGSGEAVQVGRRGGD